MGDGSGELLRVNVDDDAGVPDPSRVGDCDKEPSKKNPKAGEPRRRAARARDAVEDGSGRGEPGNVTEADEWGLSGRSSSTRWGGRRGSSLSTRGWLAIRELTLARLSDAIWGVRSLSDALGRRELLGGAFAGEGAGEFLGE